MEVYLFLAALILAILLYPYARTLFKRLALRRKLRRICKTKGYTLHPAHRLWLFGRRTGESCDFYVETPDTVYAVKLFGMKRRAQNLIVRGDSFVIRSFVRVGRPCSPRYGLNSKPKPLPEYNFRAAPRDAWDTKETHSVLLLNPACMEVRVIRDHKEVIVGNSESFSGMTLFTLAGFLGQLEGA